MALSKDPLSGIQSSNQAEGLEHTTRNGRLHRIRSGNQPDRSIGQSVTASTPGNSPNQLKALLESHPGHGSDFRPSTSAVRNRVPSAVVHGNRHSSDLLNTPNGFSLGVGGVHGGSSARS